MKKKSDDVLDEILVLREAIESACRPPRPRPAAAAAQARDDVAALHDEVFAVRLAVTSAREAGRP